MGVGFHTDASLRAGVLAKACRRWGHRRPLVRSNAFSLIEVVISVAIFAGAIVVILALLGPLNRSIGEVADHGRAARLADGINAELLRLRDTSGLAAVAALAANTGGLQLVASADGSRVVCLTKNADGSVDADKDPVIGSPPGVAPSDRYYLITVRPLSSLPAYTTGSAFLAVTATITWPYQTPGGAGPAASTDPATQAQAQVLFFNYALTP